MKASYEPGKVKATSANWVNGYPGTFADALG
jgi:hypothetical protein